MTDDSFTIKPYHWWLTLSIAIVLHVFLLVNYKQDNNHTHENVNSDQSEIIIGLKKLKPPPIVKQPNVTDTIEVVPVPAKPTIALTSAPFKIWRAATFCASLKPCSLHRASINFLGTVWVFLIFSLSTES